MGRNIILQKKTLSCIASFSIPAEVQYSILSQMSVYNHGDLWDPLHCFWYVSSGKREKNL